MRTTSLFRFFVWLGCLSVLPARVGAEIPVFVQLLKGTIYNQTSSSGPGTASPGFSATVRFSPAVSSSVTVSIEGPGGTRTLPRAAADTFILSIGFPDVASRNATFPDGAYRIVVSGGTSPGSAAVTFTSKDVPTLQLTNYAELQSYPTSQPIIKWAPVPGIAAEDILVLQVKNSTGTTVYTGGPLVDPTVTEWALPPLGFAASYTANLGYLKIDNTSTNQGETRVALANASYVIFALRSNPPRPLFTMQPAPVVAHLGSTVSFRVAGQGEAVAVQLKKNGIVVPGQVVSFLGGATTFSASVDFPFSRASDAGSYTIDAVNPSGTTTSAPAVVVLLPSVQLTPLAGSTVTSGSTDGTGPAAQFSNPADLVADRSGNVFVSDAFNHTIRKITPGGVVTTFAGSPGVVGSSDGAGSSARFLSPVGLGIDLSGNLYVADSGNRTVRKITSTGMVSTFAGLAGQSGSSDGAGNNARFEKPLGVAVDGSGNVFVSDEEARLVRKINPDGVVTTWAGQLHAELSQDGIGAGAAFARPTDLTLDATGNIFLVDSGSVRKIKSDAQVSTVWAKDQAIPFVDTGLGNGLGRFSSPAVTNLAVDPSGGLYLVNAGNLLRLVPGGALSVVAGSSLALLTPSQSPAQAGISAVSVGPDGTLALVLGQAVAKGAFQAGSANPGVVVTRPPESHVLAPGDSAVLSVEATGPGLSYQWFKDGVALTQAKERTVLVDNLTVERAGNYSVLVGNGAGATFSTFAALTLSTTADTGRLTNMSVRTRAGTGDQTFIVGTVLGQGSPGQTKSILARAIGPTLSRFGVPDVLGDPVLTLSGNARPDTRNDNWGGDESLGNAFTRVGAFALAPGSLDAAISSPLSAGAYTLQLTSVNPANGVALAELYDLSPGPPDNSSPRLLNVSTRAAVGSGGDILIAGFVIGGSTHKTLMIRGVGPGLGQFGVNDLLANPTLTLFRGTTVVSSNDDWSGDETVARSAQRVGAFPFSSATSKDAALVVTLPPGAYTAQVTGVDHSTGVALVEVYEVP